MILVGKVAKMAVSAEPLYTPESDSDQPESNIERYQIIHDKSEEPVLFLDTLDEGYAAKWNTPQEDVFSFIETVEELYTSPEDIRTNVMFHPDQKGPGQELNTDYRSLSEQDHPWEDCTSLRIMYGPHDVIWMEESPETYSIVYNSHVDDADPLDRYYRQTSEFADDDEADRILEAVHSQIEQDVAEASSTGIDFRDFAFE